MGPAEIVVGTVIAIGVIGTLVPVLPGPLMVWGAAIAYGAVVGLDGAGWPALGVITAGFGLCIYLGIAIPRHTIADEGLGWRGQILSAVLAVAGMFVVPVIGAWVGLALGVFLVRYHRTGDVAASRRSTMATVTAIGKATVLQFLTAVVMAGVWLWWALTV